MERRMSLEHMGMFAMWNFRITEDTQRFYELNVERILKSLSGVD
jgi:hypothetical protein